MSSPITPDTSHATPAPLPVRRPANCARQAGYCAESVTGVEMFSGTKAQPSTGR
ncbi:Uncharacterised protein [Amycolatopsis camponoti]|uniref:Uncharacterized protein n=1 Tax=Amycolatopsis camponoti TaxID=2606593 RepID=A0A6I8LS67_9PSEU|nr:Uncharacterised protein [Amycolatopsis camponoti]